jgi:hypothetical protein
MSSQTDLHIRKGQDVEKSSGAIGRLQGNALPQRFCASRNRQAAITLFSARNLDSTRNLELAIGCQSHCRKGVAASSADRSAREYR